MNVISLFDGISCGRLALERAGIKVSKYYASEIDKYAIKVTTRNYPDTIHLGDIKNWEAWDLPKIDLLIGGSPCQSLSINASQKESGLTHGKSVLFWKFLEVLQYVKPKYWLLENVASMTSSDRGWITKELGFLPIQINSALVSAQQRNRYYWTNIANVTQPEDKRLVVNDILENNVDTKLYEYVPIGNVKNVKTTNKRFA